MNQTGLEFAPGTTDDCKKLIVGLFTPSEILGAYRQAKATFKTGDLVLTVSQSDPSGFIAEPRHEYLRRLRQNLGANAKKTMPTLGMSQKSAHKVVQLPFDSDAFWLVVARGQDMPIMCVLFTTPYEMTAVSAAN